MAYLAPLPSGPTLSATFVRRCLVTLADRGFSRAITGALTEQEQRPFVEAGFTVADELFVLTRVLGDVAVPAPPAGTRLRRARTADRAAVVELDHLCFGSFWQLDSGGIDEAVHATPRARFRVAETEGVDGLAGYVICGRAAERGYVQRLAVHPDARRRGVAAALMLDGLRWLQRWGAAEAVVNTQQTNADALALYEHLGFERRDAGLRVLEATVRRR